MVVVVVAGFAWIALTLRAEFADSNGAPRIVVIATWMRDNNMSALTAQLENVYYTYIDKPKVGGAPTVSADLSTDVASGDVQTGASAAPAPSATASDAAPGPTARTHLTPPDTVVSPVSPAEPKEGVWQPVGTLVDGIPAVYVTRVRADDVHTSYYASLMWIDTTLAKTMFVPGYQEPGGPNPFQGALPKEYWPDVLANINGAFRLDDTQGGYYYQGTMVRPLVDGRASAVVYKDGTMNVAAWNRGVSMTPDVVSVRQNLSLLVQHGQPVAGLNANDTSQWGATLGGTALVWRSGLGVTANGAIVYVGGPAMSITDLADLLARAGCVRGMELDINTDWVNYAYFSPAPGQPATPANGTLLLSGMTGGTSRYFQTWWARDFYTMSARYPANSSETTTSTTGPTTTTTRRN